MSFLKLRIQLIESSSCIFQDHGRKKKKRKSGSGASSDAAAAQAINELHLVAIGTASGNILLYSVVKGDLHSQLVRTIVA